jgi:hypothetical protein
LEVGAMALGSEVINNVAKDLSSFIQDNINC